MATKRSSGRAAPRLEAPWRVPHYRQTTDFTCGPASLMMAMRALEPRMRIDRGLELQLWREANTIFMGPSGGHGGCSALGLALAARRRGFRAEVHVNHRGVLLGTRARSKERREVMRVLHARDRAEARTAGVPIRYHGLDIAALERKLRGGFIPIVLNSMRYLHDDPTAHWFVIAGFDADSVYVNDPWVPLRKRRTARDLTGVGIPRRLFDKVTSYGPRRERAVVLVGR